jgi:hypothetical protein
LSPVDTLDRQLAIMGVDDQGPEHDGQDAVVGHARKEQGQRVRDTSRTLSRRTEDENQHRVDKAENRDGEDRGEKPETRHGLSDEARSADAHEEGEWRHSEGPTKQRIQHEAAMDQMTPRTRRRCGVALPIVRYRALRVASRTATTVAPIAERRRIIRRRLSSTE